MSPGRDYYAILQVDPGADPDVITAAFRVLARRLHPDRDISGVQEYRMAELNRAYAVLRNPDSRRAYDLQRSAGMQAMGPGLQAHDRAGVAGEGRGLAARINAVAAASSVSGTQDSGETRLSFGRYAGQTLREIADSDTEYLRWLGRHSSGLRYRREIEQLLKESLGT